MRTSTFLVLALFSFSALASNLRLEVWSAAVKGDVSHFTVDEVLSVAPYVYRYPHAELADATMREYIVRHFDSISKPVEQDAYRYLNDFTGYIKDFSYSYKIPQENFLQIISADATRLQSIDEEISRTSDPNKRAGLIELSGELSSIQKQKEEWQSLFAKYLFGRHTNYSTIDKLIDSNHLKDAERIAHSVQNEDAKAALMTRIYLHKPNKNLRKYVDYVNSGDIMTEGIMLDMMALYHKTKNISRLVDVINAAPFVQERPDEWWKFARVAIHDLIAERKYEAAYNLLERTSINKTHPEYERKETLAGIIALKFLKDPKRALGHFHILYNSAINPEKRSQGAYYIGITHSNTKDHQKAQYWLTLAAKNPSTFYGQRAMDALNNVPSVKFLGFEKYTKKRSAEAIEKQKKIYKEYYSSMFAENYIRSKLKDVESKERLMEENDLFAIALQLRKTDENRARLFLQKAPRMISELYDENIIIDVACKDFNESTCKDAKEQAKAVGFYPIDTFYRMDVIEENIPKEHYSLVHAIVKKESKFKMNSRSGAGAAGLMQIMPATAQFIANQRGEKFDKKKFKMDAAYNIMIGDWYIFYLLNQFDGSYPLALAAYNGGAGNVRAWKERYFVPQTEEDMAMLIELIPFKETRNYVKRVLEWEAIYMYLFDTAKD